MKRLWVLGLLVTLTLGIGVAARAAGGAWPPGTDASIEEQSEVSVTSAAASVPSLTPPDTLQYVPLSEGCRLFDSRKTSGPFTETSFRDLAVIGADLSAQGGSATGCDVPAHAAAIDLSLSTTGNSPTGIGHARLGPGGVTPSNTVLQWVKDLGASVTTTTALSTVGEVRVQVFGSDTHVVGDLVGYWQENPRGLLFGGTDRAELYYERATTAAHYKGVGDYQVELDFAMYGSCMPLVSPVHEGEVKVTFAAGADRVLQIKTYDSSGAPKDMMVWYAVIC